MRRECVQKGKHLSGAKATHTRNETTLRQREKKLDEKKNQKEEFSIGPAGEKKRGKNDNVSN